MKDENDKELFSSLKELPGGSNDTWGKALAWAVIAGIIGLIIVVALNIRNKFVAYLPLLLILIVYKIIRNK